MKISFCLFRYFPYGGLQRDFLRVALACQQRGHSIEVYTMAWQGAIPEGFAVHLISVKGYTNHQRAKQFAKQVSRLLQQAHYDVVVGFNRMPGLDIYYAADQCYAASLQERAWFYRYLPRQRSYLALEQAVFERSANTQILLLTTVQQQQFTQYYQTPIARFHLLPPGIDQQRIQQYSLQQRASLRERYAILPEQKIILMVGSNFKGKGVDRALIAVAELPLEIRANTRLWVVGQGKVKPMQALARRLKIADQVSFLGPKEALADYYAIADLLLHPAYHEAAGMVLLEALCSGVPVLVTANCGYAYHIAQAQAGGLIPEPFKQQIMNQQLLDMLISPAWQTWHENALHYAATTDLYHLTKTAVALIEQYSANQKIKTEI